MRFFRHLFASLMLLCSTVVCAYDFSVGGIKYKITDLEEKTVSVYEGISKDTVIIPESVVFKDITYKVTKIENFAFRYTSIVSLTIPNTIKSIGYGAFSYCESFKELNVGCTWTDFDLYDFDHPVNPKINVLFFHEFDEHKCHKCGGERILTGNCGDDVKYSLDRATGVLTISGNGSISDYGEYVYWYPHTYEAPWQASRNLVTSVVIEEGITGIGNYAFAGCSKIKSITSYAKESPTLGISCFETNYSWGEFPVLNYPSGSEYWTWAKYSQNPDFAYEDIYETDIEWYFDYKNAIAYAYGSGELKTDDLIYRDHFRDINTIKINGNFSSIADNCFDNTWGKFDNIKEVVLPETITSIGDYAFNQCYNLKNIRFPLGLVSIGDYAFNQVPLDFVVIPQTVTSIGNYAFNSGYLIFKSFNGPTFGELNGVGAIVPEGANSYPSSKFSDIGQFYSQQEFCIRSFWNYELDIPISTMFVFGNADQVDTNSSTIQDVENVLFSPDATGYNLISILPNVKKVEVQSSQLKDRYLYGIPGSNAVFMYKEEQAKEQILVAGCATTIIPEGTTIIDDNAFHDCAGLKRIEIPQSVYQLGNETFYGCSGLESIVLPNTITSYGWYTFNNCSALKKVVVNSERTPEFKYCSSLTNLVLGSDVNAISSNDFLGCSSLKNISVDAANTKYDSRESCNAIIETESNKLILGGLATKLPNSVLSVGGNAFVAWKGDMHVPSSVTKIERGAFNCADRTIFESETPPTITGNVFGWGAVFVPTLAYDAYCNAPVWSDYKEKIVTNELANKDIEVYSSEGMSGILDAVGLDNADKVVRLKVAGEINSYDMIVIRDKMPLLNELDLSEAVVVASAKPYYGHTYCTTANSFDGYAFYNLDKLLKVKLPKNLKSLGEKAFYDCDRLTNVDASASGVLEISKESFYSCEKLVEFVSPANITEVCKDAFSGCTNLGGIELRDISASIASSAFARCTQLKTIEIDSLGENIEEYAFKNCANLSSVYIGSMGGELQSKAFAECKSLKNVIFENGPIRIGSIIFEHSDSLETFVAGEGTTVIDAQAFYASKTVDYGYYSVEEEIERTALKKVELPHSVKSIGKMAFNRCVSLQDFTMPQSVTQIGEKAFYYCRSLKNITIPDAITNLANNVFDGCSSLKDVTFPSELEGIGNRSFAYCGFENMQLPPTLKTIGAGAFCGNYSLTELHIPSAVENIGASAFEWCSNLNAVYTYTVEPTSISENTFSTFASANLYVPSTSFWNYYWDNGWSRFDHKKFVEFNKPYSYFYLNKDYYLNGATGYIEGNPNADMRPGSGLVVEKDENNGQQNLGNVNVVSDGNGNCAAIIGDDNLHIDDLCVKINVKAGRWYFFAFPWDVPLQKVSMLNGSDYVFRYYDGKERAKNGSGGWKNVNESHLKAAQGYIFQSSADDVLTLSIKDVKFRKMDKFNELVTHTSDNLNDASWNLMGNPYLSYYDMAAMDYTAPVTVWDGTKYLAIRPGDDDYQFAPYEAFFVQKPEGKEHVGFGVDGQLTKTQSTTLKQQQQEARRTRMANPFRKIVNLVLALGSVEDRTRVVFNEYQKPQYEPTCDAAKFESAGVPQLYTLDSIGVRYAINERPKDNGVVRIGYSAAKAGNYTIDVARMETKVILYDAETGKEHDFEDGVYSFYSDKGTFDSRFSLGIPKDEETGIEEVGMENVVEVADGGLTFKTDEIATIYNMSGNLVATQNGTGFVKLQPGVYIVCVEKGSMKILVK